VPACPATAGRRARPPPTRCARCATASASSPSPVHRLVHGQVGLQQPGGTSSCRTRRGRGTGGRRGGFVLRAAGDNLRELHGQRGAAPDHPPRTTGEPRHEPDGVPARQEAFPSAESGLRQQQVQRRAGGGRRVLAFLGAGAVRVPHRRCCLGHDLPSADRTAARGCGSPSIVSPWSFPESPLAAIRTNELVCGQSPFGTVIFFRDRLRGEGPERRRRVRKACVAGPAQGGRRAIVDGSVRPTWGGRPRSLGALGASLERVGIPSGEVVGTLARNSGPHLVGVARAPGQRAGDQRPEPAVGRCGAAVHDRGLRAGGPRWSSITTTSSAAVGCASSAPRSAPSDASRTGPAIRVRCTEWGECPLAVRVRWGVVMPMFSAAGRGRWPARRIYA
jgi:hypothetical protein